MQKLVSPQMLWVLTSWQGKLPRTTYNTVCINLNNQSASHLSMKWFCIELMVLNRTIIFTNKSWKSHLCFKVCSLSLNCSSSGETPL